MSCAAFFSCSKQVERSPRQSGAGVSLSDWAAVRAWPFGRVRGDLWSEAFWEAKTMSASRNNQAVWEALGPKNFGGRTLCMAFHPSDPDVMWAGSASGGLWKTQSAGLGPEAWERVETGYPVLGVSSIALNPDNPDEMYIGTGEVYNYTIAQPGVYDRLTRGSYGVGLLKTTDGGQTWSKSLDFTLADMTCVWDIAVNPLRPATVFAATTRGLYRSYNAGSTWVKALDGQMGLSVVWHPQDTNVMLATFGGYLSPFAGVFRSVDGGKTFAPVNGLPADYTGRAHVSFARSNPNVVYATVSNAFNGIGLFRSEDAGINWAQVNGADVPLYQGWYSNDVAVNPDDPESVLWAGVDMYKSFDGGANVQQVSYWFKWTFGLTPVGGPEGPFDYVHADIHRVYFSPHQPGEVFAATDGGVFFSPDAGDSWEGRNGGMQTQQFYARFANSAQDPHLAIGGMQDNATAIYVGQDAWFRTIGGDGMCAAIHPLNDTLMYGSSQRLNIRRSINRGQSFMSAAVSSAANESKSFNGPFVLAPSQPSRIYAGAQRVHRSDNGGINWGATSAANIDGANTVIALAVAPQNPDLLYAATAPLASPPRLFKSVNGGQTWSVLSGLPDRVVMGIAFHPTNPDIVFVALSGYGSAHLWVSHDSGASWSAIDDGVPDVPANCILVDPAQPAHLYLGNDLGVWFSPDAGLSWSPYGVNAPAAVMVADLSISAHRKLRIATHGLGVYQTDMAYVVKSAEPARIDLAIRVWPNPAKEALWVACACGPASEADWTLYDASGRVSSAGALRCAAGEFRSRIATAGLRPGVYFLRVRMDTGDERTTRIVVTGS
ncbi:MAG: T9SS type A sorting domain-containing protein [Saprospiraceae bacterium]